MVSVRHQHVVILKAYLRVEGGACFLSITEKFNVLIDSCEMWTSLCNFLCNKLFHRSGADFQQSNDSSDGIYGKRLKLVNGMWGSNGLLNSTNPCSMQKENVEISDDECCIIAEIPRRKKPGSSVTTQKPLKCTLHAKHSQQHECWPKIVFHEVLPDINNCDKDIEETKYINKAPEKNINTNAQTKKFFNSQRAYLSYGKVAKSRLSFKHQLRRKLNFLQESYRLTEKHQYMQLLQSHTTYDLFNTKTLRNCESVDKEPEITILSDEKYSGNEEKEIEKKSYSDDDDIQIVKEIPIVRSFQDIWKIKPLNAEIAFKEMSCKHYKNNHNVVRLPINVIDDEDVDINKKTDALEEKLRNFMLISTAFQKNKKVENKGSYYLPELTFEQEKKIQNSLLPEPSQEILSQRFGLQITRQDMQTLVGLNWLNDEIINFYMNLIMERSKNCNKLPKVYAFNTFFYPKLISSGYAGLRRWTKQVDIFSFDIILVPIHLGMHWCLSVIDFRNKSVQYYDSIGSPNDSCLERLLFYLEDESLDKKKNLFPTNNWKKLNVEKIPQQMNGGDCGVFCCMFAEHLARDCPILFTQDDMPYFRRKIVIEILEKKLLT